MDAGDVDTSGDIGLFDDTTEDEAISTECSSADEDPAYQGRVTESETTEDDSDDSEWAPDAVKSLEPATVTRASRGLTMIVDIPASPLQHKSRMKTSGAEEPCVPGRRMSFDNLFEDCTGNAEDSTIIIPNKQARKAALTQAGQGSETVPQSGEVDDIPKKKRR